MCVSVWWLNTRTEQRGSKNQFEGGEMTDMGLEGEWSLLVADAVEGWNGG